MAAPSKNFDTIADAEIDPDSPITTGLLNKYRNRDDHLEEWLGASFVAAVDHDHDGVNSKSVIGASLIFLERHETSADETSFDFSATLDGDTEAVYLLTGRWKKTDAAVRSLSLRVNGASASLIVTITTAATPIFTFFFGLIFAKRTVQTVSMNPGYTGLAATSVPAAATFGGNFTLAANLTSLGLEASSANSIHKGSSFTLYRVRQS